ncbi:hypothetical protein HYH03_015923 [Edaphochlamys debaryana]|uniref:Uncharacterized protein n=1 Tax=Edaphochlamys debaryana TaxID=47281 RepID=A0A835XIJ5_9CHLO|nr:hypothetical protein HYH03_015923 [Edaphochlamys debaryana]|eukprot:KAG2485342.1 hypothetical protein HYH03_015923 [Edaphochlamys debaryana]
MARCFAAACWVASLLLLAWAPALATAQRANADPAAATTAATAQGQRNASATSQPIQAAATPVLRISNGSLRFEWRNGTSRTLLPAADPDPTPELCPNAAWKGWVFLRSAPTFDPLAWSQDQWEAYLKDYQLRSAAFSLALLALGLVGLLGFLAWRLVQWCVGCSASGCGPCCPGPGCGGRCGGGCGRRCGVGSESGAFLGDRKHTVLKVLASLLLLGAVGMAGWGMAGLDPALVGELWGGVRAVLALGGRLDGNLAAVETQLVSYLPSTLHALRREVQAAANTSAAAAAAAQEGISFALSSVATASGLASSASSAAAALANATGALAALAAQLGVLQEGAGNASGSGGARRSLRADNESANATLSALLPALAAGLPAVEALPGTAAGVRGALQALGSAAVRMAGLGPADPTPPPGDAAAALAAALGGLRLTEWGEALGNATRGLEAYGEARSGPALRITAEAARTVAEASAALSPEAAAALAGAARNLSASFGGRPRQALEDLRLRLASLDRDVVAVGGWSVRLGNGTSVQIMNLTTEVINRLTRYLDTGNGTNDPTVQPPTAANGTDADGGGQPLLVVNGRRFLLPDPSQPWALEPALQALTSAAAALSAAAPSAAALASAASAAAALASSGPDPGPLAGLLRASLGPALASLRGPAGALGDALTAHTADPSSTPKLRALRQALIDQAPALAAVGSAFRSPALQELQGGSEGRHRRRRRLQGQHGQGEGQGQGQGQGMPDAGTDGGNWPQGWRQRRLQQDPAAAPSAAAAGAAEALAAAAARLGPVVSGFAGDVSTAGPRAAAAYGNLTAAYGGDLGALQDMLRQYAAGLEEAVGFVSQLPSPEQVAAAVSGATAELQSEADSLIDDALDACSDAVRDVTSARRHVRDDVLDPAYDIVHDYQPVSEDAAHIAYAVWMALWALAAAALLGLVWAAWAHWIAGLVGLVMLLLGLSIVGQILAAALGFGMQVLHDACGGQIEQSALREAVRSSGSQRELAVALSYYVYGVPYSVDDAFLLAFNVSTAQVQSSLRDAQQRLQGEVTAKYRPQGRMAALLSDLDAGVESTRTAFDAALQGAAYSQIHPAYVEVKGSLCCDAGDFAFREWCALTAAVCLFLAALLPCAYLLARMDLMRREACCGCCGCVPRRPPPKQGGPRGRAAAPAKPPGEQLVQRDPPSESASPPGTRTSSSDAGGGQGRPGGPGVGLRYA